MAQSDAVYATLVMTDSYLPGAMVLGHSLRDRGAKAKLVACVLLNNLSLDTISELQTVYDDIAPVEHIVNLQPANLYLMNRPDLISTFTKIELWRQTQYKRIVYLDADMVVLRAPNELLKMETNFAAVPDVGWPDCFNSGMMVLNPNMADYYALLALARRGISFDGADQGLLNMHFTDWERLSFIYNCTPNANYQYVPAYRHFQSSINIIHFIGAEKPWTLGRDHKSNIGVYGELLARWWAVYDRHYRPPKPVSSGQFVQPRKKVQDYVRGEDSRYEPSYQPQLSEQRRHSRGYQITEPQPQPVPGIHVTAPPEDTGAMERPFGDQPALDEKIQQENYQPTSTQEQRRWSAPHAEWEPARQPPPPGSRPEAANFPSQQYEMSDSRELFEPPTVYPEPPKDMWYAVPDTKPQPRAPPKAIFPWEESAPKATRVFPRSREATPPPPEPAVAQAAVSGPAATGAPALQAPAYKPRQPSLTQAIEAAFSRPAKPPSPPRHVFPWEARAPKATRVFPQEKPPTAPTTHAAATDTHSGTATASEVAAGVDVASTPRAPGTAWDSFAQQTNKWDEDPDIARFMESFNKPRRAPIQVVHDSRTESHPEDGPPPVKERRTSVKLTDFPTEVERPSLPVTPAPIRRPTYWGADESAEQGKSVLPVAKGVPRQDEWNPIIKLEELQRRQSLIMTGDDNLVAGAKTPPRRVMPDSKSREEAIEAAMKAMRTSHEKPKVPAKPILREPHFEVSGADARDLTNEGIVISAHTTATGSKSPTRFNPIILEGEAASERISYDSKKTAMKDESGEPSTATHHSTSSFSYSTSSLSPTTSRASLREDAAKTAIEEDVLSPKSTNVQEEVPSS